MPIRDLGFDASTNVSQNITSENPGSITGKVIDKTVTKPFHMSMSFEGDKFITGGITSEGNFTSKPRFKKLYCRNTIYGIQDHLNGHIIY
jgi:hypothetical protein